MATGSPASLLASKNWSPLIKQLDEALSTPGGASQAQLLLNRGFCLQQLGLFRKALKVGRMAGMAEAIGALRGLLNAAVRLEIAPGPTVGRVGALGPPQCHPPHCHRRLPPAATHGQRCVRLPCCPRRTMMPCWPRRRSTPPPCSTRPRSMSH